MNDMKHAITAWMVALASIAGVFLVLTPLRAAASEQYSIVGDLSSREDWRDARIRVVTEVYDSEGARSTRVLSESVARDGRIVDHHGSVDRPTAVEIRVVAQAFLEGDQAPTLKSEAKAVVEQGSVLRIELKPVVGASMLLVSGEGKHRYLVESWQKDKQLLARVDVVSSALKEFSSEGSFELFRTIMEGSRSNSDFAESLLDEVVRLQDDPLDTLLAIELGGLKNSQEGVDLLDAVDSEVGREASLYRVTPLRDRFQTYLDRAATLGRLDVGAIVPLFSASTVTGEKVALQEVLDGNPITLVYFWASWCAPCISTFNKMKPIYDEYKALGFEIVTVSVDRDRDDWLEKSGELGLPWIDLRGDSPEGEGSVADLYGVSEVPRSFLLQEDGEILFRDIETRDLEDYLESGLKNQGRTLVRGPWHFTNIRITTAVEPVDIDSYCVAFTVKTDVVGELPIYISPINQRLNKVPIYSGIQTRIDGFEDKNDPDGRRVYRRRGAIFSRWDERNIDATRQAPGGLFESGGYEGDFISVRNDFAWSAGSYRLCLMNDDVVDGPSRPLGHRREDISYGWGRFAHTLIRMEATDMASGETTLIGALGFPGRTMSLDRMNTVFYEVYGRGAIRPSELRPFNIVIDGIEVDGKVVAYSKVVEVTNPYPRHAHAPVMVRSVYVPGAGIASRVGEFTGEYGSEQTVLHGE